MKLFNKRFLLAGLTLCFIVSGCAHPAERPLETLKPPANAASATGSILFVPADGASVPYVESVADFMRKSLHIPIVVSKPVNVMMWHRDLMDSTRHQVRGKDYLNAALRQTVESLPNSIPEDVQVMIVFTSQDMYDDTDPGNNFVFALTGELGDGKGASAISITRLDPSASGGKHDSAVTKSRLRKEVAQKIGMLYYKLPRSSDPNNIMYDGTSRFSAIDYANTGY